MANTVLLQIRNITKSFGPKKIFDEANVSFGERQKIGVIGPNGAGKTTFFKILMKQETPDSGEILWMPNLRLGYIEQHDAFEENETVIGFLERYTGKPEWECAKVASQFQLKNEKLTGKITDLSGGWQMRVKLTATLLFEPNLLLLDEPTNYLDLSTLMLLENFLLTFKGTVLVITHDREFIKKTCTSILDVEHGQLFLHHEPLEKYLEFKIEREKLAASVNVNIERKQKQLQTFVDRFGSKAAMAKSAQSKLKQIDKLEEEKVITVAKSATVRMHIPPIETRDGMALECRDLTIGYDGKNEKSFKNSKVEKSIESNLKITNTTKNQDIHLIGIFSDSDKYSKLEDWAKMIQKAVQNGAEKIVLHLIADGIDTDKKLMEIWNEFVQKYEEILKPLENKIFLGSLNSEKYINSLDLQKVIFSLISVLDYRLGTNIDQEQKLSFIQKCNKFLREKYDFKTETLNDLECYFYDLENNFVDIAKVLERFDKSSKLPKMIVPQKILGEEITQIRNHVEAKNTICFINKLDRFAKILSEINTEFDLDLDILDLENENLENQTLTKNQAENPKNKTKIIAANINLEVNRGLKVAILGDNGQGKSTLLKTMAGELSPLSGICEFKNGLKVAYYHQHVAANLDPNETVFDFIKRGDHKEEVIYRVLSNFLFKKTDYLKQIKVLSGGEKARLCLAGMFLSKADVYLLDEPTNHLDFETVEAMGKALGEFNGTVFVISHNRTFVSLIATEIWEVNAGQVKRVLGTYTDYLWSKEEQIRQEMRFGEKYPVSSAATPLEKGNSETPSSQNNKFAHFGSKEKAKKLYETKKEIGKIEKKIKNAQELIAQNEQENKTEHAEKNQAILSDLEIIYLELLEDVENLI